jgi:hypothetical protein
VIRKKPEYTNWRKYYIVLWKECRLDRREMIIRETGIVGEFSHRFELTSPNRAAKDNDVLSLFSLVKSGRVSGPKGIRGLISNGNLELLIWLQNLGAVFDQRSANLGAVRGHVEILDWLAAQRILPDDRVAGRALKGVDFPNRTEVLKWLFQRGIKEWRSRGRYDFILGTRLYDFVDCAIDNKNLDLLSWLHDHGQQSTREQVTRACNEGRIKVLIWMAKKRLEPTYLYTGAAIKFGDLDFLEWLWNRKIYPLEEAIEFAQEHNQPKIVEWLNVRWENPDWVKYRKELRRWPRRF